MGCPAGFLLAQCRGWAQTSGISVPSSPWSLKGDLQDFQTTQLYRNSLPSTDARQWQDALG